MTVVEELRQNPEQGAKRLESEYRAGLMTLALRFCHDEGDAEELVNRTFAAVVAGIDDYLEQSAFFGWMCQILSNLHGMDQRRKSRCVEETDSEAVANAEDVESPARLFQEVDASLLRDAIATLPEVIRKTLLLHYFMEIPVREVARVLTVPSGTVMWRLHYARMLLGAKLGVVAKKPGAKALLIALALCALTALGAAVARVATTPSPSQSDVPAAPSPSDDQADSGVGEGASPSIATAYLSSTFDDFSLFHQSFALSALSDNAPPTPQENAMLTPKATSALLASASLALASTPSPDTIAYWPFGNSGFADVSGNGHDLASTTVTESDAGYITLNGTSQFLTTASALDLSGETAVTFECWTKMTAENKDFPLLMSSANPTAGTGGFVLYYGKSLHIFQAQYRMAESGSSVWQMEKSTAANQLQDDSWHHVAYVVDRSKTGWGSARLYVDGVEQTNNYGKDGSVPAFFNDYFMIGGGANYASGNNFYTGCIDDVRISRGALTPDQFLKFPSVGKAMRADDGSLPVIAHWPFGGKGGRDASGNGFDLVMSNVLFKAGTPYTSWSTRTEKFACSPNQTIPFSAFSNTGLTIEMFVMAQSSSTNMAMILESSKSYWSYKGSFRISYDANPDGYRTISTTFHINSDKSAGSATSEATFGNLGDNKWRHIAIVYDPSKTGAGIVTLYVDGVPGTCSAANANQGAFALGDLPLYFFRRANSQIGDERTALPFYGSIDDVRITGCALTPDQFLPARSVGSTVALYRFDRETLEDQTGNGNDLVHMHTESTVADPVFGDAGFPDSGTGLVLSGTEDKSGNIGTRDWVKTAASIDFSETKAFTIEFDFNSNDPISETVIPSGKTDKPVYVVAASTQVATRGGFVVYSPGASLQGQFRTNTGSGWLKYYAQIFGDMKDGYRRGRYSVNGKNSGHVYFNLVVDGVANSQSSSSDYGSFGSHVIGFGHCPSYYADATTPYYMKGKLLRAAISDIALDPADYVLDNLVLDTPKATLAYWNFKSGAGLASDGVSRRRGALNFDGASSASTTNLTLSALTQATIECFVCFGETPSSGAVFSLGSGAGSFSVAADATAGTLSGSFIPYDHLAASNGGTAALAPLAGKKTWHHVALVIDRTNPGADAVRFYVDYERATPAGRAWDAAAAMLDGAIVIGEGFTGRIDDLRVSAGALEPNEFLQPGARTETPDAFTIIIR